MYDFRDILHFYPGKKKRAVCKKLTFLIKEFCFCHLRNKRAMMALDRFPESFSLQMKFYIFVPFVPTCDHQGGASFDPKGHHVNKIDKGLQ